MCFSRKKKIKKISKKSIDLTCTFMTMIRMERRKGSRNKEKSQQNSQYRK